MIKSAALLLLAAGAVLVCSVAGQTAGCGRSKIGLNRIVGGTTAIKGQYPWQVDILEVQAGGGYSHICGGTLISNSFVLTAAHCFYGKAFSQTRYLLVLGEHDQRVKEGTELQIYPSQLIMHTGYVHQGQYNDIALLRLAQPINIAAYPYINTACLPQATENFLSNTRCVSTGWGMTQGFQNPTILQVVGSTVMSSVTCKAYFPSVTDSTKICFGNGQRGPCMGDSGGPLSCPRADGSFAVAGIVSYGTQTCTQYPYPSVYTNVAAYRSWIQSYTGL